MTKVDIVKDMKIILSQDPDFLKPVVQQLLQEFLEAEMVKTIGADAYKRCDDRTGYRSGYYSRQLVTRVGTMQLRVPRDREGKFSTQLFERYQRSEKALVAALAEMYVQGVSTRKVKAITEELCGHDFSASTISNINKMLDSQLQLFAQRRLERPYPYVILDARYEKVRTEGAIASQAILVAIGINQDGKKEILGVELANRESRASWKGFLTSLKNRGLCGVGFVVSDHHEGLKKAIREIYPEALWQRCFVHFLRNAFDYLPKKGDNACLQELRQVYEQRNIIEAQKELRAWLGKWEDKYPKLCLWAEENVGETLSFYQLPPEHYKQMRSTNLLERLNEEIKRRTRVVRIFPNEESCLRLIRALAVEVHETWLGERVYLNMDLLKEQKKERMIKEQSVA